MSESFRFVSAGAGSGKTYRLTELLHDMLLDGQVRASGVLATTFTNRAAAELRERVRSHLIDKGQHALATAIGQARIGTVNSVCGNLLARFAFEAGMPVEQYVLDEGRAAHLLSQSIDEVIDGRTLTHLLMVARRLCLDRVVYGDGPYPWKTALCAIVSQARSNAISPTQLRDFGRQNADQLLAFFPTATSRDLDAELLKAIKAVLPIVRQALKVKHQNNIEKYLEQLEGFDQDLRGGHAHWAQWNKLANSEPCAKLRDTVQTVAALAAEHEKHPRLHQDIREYLETLFSLAADVLETFRDHKRQLGAVDFTDQECELLAVLSRPEVAETLAAELDLLMVDEFQDTSPIQLALFLKLAHCAKHVVWVGDVKQAIYGFRGGDATLMTAVVNALPALKGKKETLQTSRRSRPALVHCVNQLFGAVFNGLSAPDVHLQPQRQEFQGAHAVEDWMLEGKNSDEQYHAIAAGIATLLQAKTSITDPESGQLRPLQLGDIVVLARSNNTVNALAEVLQAQGIMVSTEQPGLLSRPESVLALACLRRLIDENDTIASAEIVSLAECEDPDVWLAERLAWLDSGQPRATWRETGDAAHPIFKAIRSLREQRSQLSPREAVNLIAARCRLSRHVLQWQQSADKSRLRLANLNRLAELAGEYEDTCRSTHEAATLSGLLLWLQDLAATSADTMPQPTIDAVQVMTHHAAKGLEWPVVVLVELASNVKDSIWDAVRAESAGAFDVHDPLKDRFLRYWPWPYGSQVNVPVADFVANSPAAQAVRSAATEEHKRLLYVSMTRARDVVILARQKKKPDGEWMATVGLAGFLPQIDAATITLASGHSVPFIRRHLNAGSPALASSAPRSDLSWFETPAQLRDKLPLMVNPSQAASVQATVIDAIKIGTRIDIDRNLDPAVVGHAVHACLAAFFSWPDAPFKVPDIQGILDRMGLAQAISHDALLSQFVAVQDWIDERWPNAKTYVEIPATQLLRNGQMMNGRIDLLVKTESGWILIDYKSGAQNSSQWEILAATYGGQLAAYGAAIEAATGVEVSETWLVLPVAGAGLRVQAAATHLNFDITKVA